MAVTLSAVEVAAATGTKPATATRLLAVATALIEQYGAVAAPEAVQNESALRVAGYLHGQPKPSIRAESMGSVSVDYAPSRQGALRHSGAMALLSPFKVRRAGAIG